MLAPEERCCPCCSCPLCRLGKMGMCVVPRGPVQWEPLSRAVSVKRSSMVLHMGHRQGIFEPSLLRKGEAPDAESPVRIACSGSCSGLQMERHSFGKLLLGPPLLGMCFVSCQEVSSKHCTKSVPFVLQSCLCWCCWWWWCCHCYPADHKGLIAPDSGAAFCISWKLASLLQSENLAFCFPQAEW